MGKEPTNSIARRLYELLFGHPPKAAVSKPKYELEPFKGDNGGGFVVVRTRDDKHLNWRSLPARSGLLAFKVMGTSFRRDALRRSDFEPGRALRLVPEPENPKDPNAVSVRNDDGTIHVGYVPAEEAKVVGARLQSGTWRCLSMWEHLDEAGQRVGLRALLIAHDADVDTKGH